MKLLAFAFFTLVFKCCFGAVDDTLTAGRAGPKIVEAVLDKIESSCLFEDDKLFFRRVAFVETSDGLDGSFNGGIWKLDEPNFLAIKQLFSLSSYKAEILNKFGINWNSLSYTDLAVPFYSGLAARLFMIGKQVGIPIAISDQANVWAAYYRIGGDKNAFIAKASKLQNGCSKRAADVLFVVDESGSIGLDNYNKMKQFLKDVTSSLNVGPDPIDHTRVSLIKFSNYVDKVFNFNTYTTAQQYVNAIDRMSYFGGGTQTDLALKYVYQSAFDLQFGARPTADGVPRLVIVLTDGYSNDMSATIREAIKVHAAQINVIAIGIGSFLNEVELKEIATDPDCKNFLKLQSFTEIVAFNSVIEKKSCEVPIIVDVIDKKNFTLPVTESKTCKITVSPTGTTVEISTGQNTVVYFSNDTVPSSSYYDIKLKTGPSSPAVLHIPNLSSDGSTTFAYCLIEGNPNASVDVTLVTVTGDQDPCNKNSCPSSQVCNHRPNWAYECVTDGSGYNCQSNSPCTKENASKNKFYFSYLQDARKFIQCDEWQSCFLMTCPAGLVWDDNAYICTQSGGNSDPSNNTPTSSAGYNCNTNNPCTPANAQKNKFYFPYLGDAGKFVQCNDWQECFIMPCPAGLVWNDVAYTCTKSQGNGNSGTSNNQPTNSGFSCGANNPCTTANAQQNKFYFPYLNDPSKFVQCTELQQCFVMPCPATLIWNIGANSCTRP